MDTIQGHTSIGHQPHGRWAFDESVTACFHDMLFRSIPQLEVMRQAVFHLGCSFVHADDTILDLGCSLGDALMPFIQRYGVSTHYIGLETSQPMLEACQARFRQFGVSDLYGDVGFPNINIRQCDLRHDFPENITPSLILSILTLMFIPLEYRSRVARRAYRALKPGGACIIVEKIIGAHPPVAELLIEQYHAFKAHQGYSQEDIQRKAMALEGVLVPLTAKANEDLLRDAGFTHIECFWRWMNFCGWIAIKE